MIPEKRLVIRTKNHHAIIFIVLISSIIYFAVHSFLLVQKMKSNTLLKIAVMVLVPLLVVSLYYNAVLIGNKSNTTPYTPTIPGRNDMIVSGISASSLGLWDQGYSLTENTIIVSGSGTAYAEPNVTVINVRITTENPLKTASEAYEYVVSKASQLVNALKDMNGVIELKTVNLGLQPVYDYSGSTRIFRGYNAYYQLMVTASLSEAGRIIAAIVENGGNVIDSIYLTYPKQVVGKAYEQALEKALENAKEKAETIAQKLGVKITSVRAVSLVSIQSYQPVQYNRVYYEAAVATANLPSAPIETGEQPVATANVIVVFNIES